MSTVMDLVKEIKTTRTKESASAKDEIRVMQAMLNDKDFKVDVYDKNGVSGSYCPYEESRIMLSSIIKDTTKINSAEASELAYNYEFGKKESTIMVGISKEFVNTYIETGRKLPLGGREKSNISLAKKVKPAKANTYPKKVGVNADGTDKYETVNEGMIPEHISIRVFGSCPSWVKQK